MKKTLIIAAAAGLALSSGVEETQDNELIMQSIKNGYYTVSNAILSRPAMIAGGMQMIQNGMARPTFLNHFDETADDEFMAKGHGQGHEHSQGKQKGQKGKKGKDGKKPKPQPEPVQEVQPVEQAQDNNLALEDDEFGALNVGVNGGNNGFGANAGYQGNIGRNGNWNVGGQIQTQPGGRPNWGVNAGVTIKFDEQDDEFFVEDLQDDELGALNLGVNGGNNGFGANAGYQGNIGRNGNWNVGGQIQTQPGGRPNWGVNAGVTIRFDEQADEFFAEDQDDEFFAEDQDDEFFAEDQDDELFMQSIKNGYYTVSNAILSRPAMIAGGMQMIQNGMARPTFLNHFDEVADDELGALNVGVNGGNNGFGANAGYQGNIGRNGNWNVGGQIQTQPGGRPNWGVNAGVTIKFDEQDDEFFVEDLQDDELGALNVGVNGGNNGFGANAGYQGNIGRNGNWNVGGQIQTQPGGRPNWGVNAGVTIKFDEQDDEFAAVEKTEKTEKPRRKRQPLERPEGMIKRNTKLRVPKEVAADNTLFDLAELLEDN